MSIGAIDGTMLDEIGMGHDAWLKMLIAQLTNQSPLDPVKDEDFMGQMAQYATLEQITQLNEKLNDFLGAQNHDIVTLSALQSIGKTVHAYDEQYGVTITGTAVGVKMSGTDVYVTVHGINDKGEPVEVDVFWHQILQVEA